MLLLYCIPSSHDAFRGTADFDWSKVNEVIFKYLKSVTKIFIRFESSQIISNFSILSQFEIIKYFQYVSFHFEVQMYVHDCISYSKLKWNRLCPFWTTNAMSVTSGCWMELINADAARMLRYAPFRVRKRSLFPKMLNNGSADPIYLCKRKNYARAWRS